MDAAIVVAPGDAAGRHADRRDPAAIFVESLHPADFAGHHLRQLIRMGQQCPCKTGDGVARLVLAAADRQLDVGADAVHRHAGLKHHRQQAVVRGPAKLGDHRVDRRIDAPRRLVAARLDVRIAGIVRDAVDHGLGPGIHVLEAHVGEAGDRLEAFRRIAQRERRAQIGPAERCEVVEHGIGMVCERGRPGIAHGLRRDGGEDRMAFGHMLVAVLAHHVVAHQDVHQPGGLVRGEDGDVLLADIDVVATCDQRRTELGNIGDGRIAPHRCERRIGVAPERGQVDFHAWCIRHRRFLPARLSQRAGRPETVSGAKHQSGQKNRIAGTETAMMRISSGSPMRQ